MAVVLAILSRRTVLSLAVACLVGVLLMGQGILALPVLVYHSLVNKNFMYIGAIELCIGVLVAFLQRSGAVALFSTRAWRWAKDRKRVNVLAWMLGLVIFFSDYFSPLFVGPVMRPLTDKFRVSREKLAYICDSTSAPMVSIVPFSSWAVYAGGLAIGLAGIGHRNEAMQLFLRSIPYNFYGFLSVILVLCIALKIVPDFGPMRRAEKRARETGKVIRDGAVPMMSKDLTELKVTSSPRTHIFFHFVLPVLIIIFFNLTTFFLTGSARLLESFLLACLVLGLLMRLYKLDTWKGLSRCIYAGIKGVMPAVMILAMAFCINSVSRDMQTAEFIVNLSREWLQPALLPMLVFFISGFVSFATGTSFGTYAIMIPIALPLAYQFSGGTISPFVLSSFAAVIGGGVFGDHCSPLSDTTVLSSLGGACDHIDHVKTQLPYAILTAALVSGFYLIVGFWGA